MVDPDGRVRIVLSVKDPGVRNWIDPSGFPKAFAQWRWYLSDRYLVPETKLVPLEDLRRHLPATTATVSPEERRVHLAARRHEVGRRYRVSAPRCDEPATRRHRNERSPLGES